jgi:hypothetical protein
MINRAKMPRQLRGKGGITNAVPREKYGLGSDLKKFVRKVIPNEIADVAVKAAPFVAPFNPAVGALMRGIGRFDQRGSISDALKQGIATFGFGAGARKLGGAEDVFGGGLRDFSSPLSEGRTASVKNFFEGKKLTPEQKEKGKGILPENFLEKTTGKIPGVRALPPIVQEQLLAGGITAGASLLASYFQGDFREPEPEETMEDYLAARKEYVGTQMRTYMDNYFKFDPEYSALDNEGKDAFVARYNVRDGGRIGYQTGGISSANTLAQNIARNRAAQSAFQQSISPAQQRTRQKITQRLEDFGNKLTGVVEGARDYAVPVVQGARALLTGAGEPIITDSMRRDLIKRAQAKGGDSGILGYEDYGLTPAGNVSGGRFGGGITDIISDPQAFANAATLGRVTFNKDPKTGEYSFGDTKYDFNIADTDTGLAANLLRGINVGGLKTAIPNVAKDLVQGTKNLLTPTTATAAEPVPQIQTLSKSDQDRFKDLMPYKNFREGVKKYFEGKYGSKIGDETSGYAQYSQGKDKFYQNFSDEDRAGLKAAIEAEEEKFFGKKDRPTMADVAGPATQGLIPGFTAKERSDGRLEYTAPDGQTYGPETYASIAAGRYPDIYDPNKATLAKGGMPMGIMRTNKAGVMERDYRDKGGFVPVGIKEKADDVPAMLSKNEFVMTANAVRGAGNGSIEKGAQRMYDTMKRLEKRVR